MTSGYGGAQATPYTILANYRVGSGNLMSNEGDGESIIAFTELEPLGKFGAFAFRLKGEPSGHYFEMTGATLADDWTCDYWFIVNDDAVENDIYLFRVDAGGSGESVSFKTVSGAIQPGGSDVASSYNDSGAVVGKSIWQHFAVVRDSAAGTLTAYLNGVKIWTVTAATLTGTVARVVNQSLSDMAISGVRWSRRKEWTGSFAPPTSYHSYSSGSGYDSQTPTPNKLTIAGTNVALSDAGSRVDLQCDGTNTVYQFVGHSLETIAADASVATLIAKMQDAGLMLVSES